MSRTDYKVPLNFPPYKIDPIPGMDSDRQSDASILFETLFTAKTSNHYLSDKPRSVDHFQRYSNKYFHSEATPVSVIDTLKTNSVYSSKFLPAELHSSDTVDDLDLDENEENEENPEVPVTAEPYDSADDADDYGTMYQDFEDGEDFVDESLGNDEPEM
ncbi:hypothetical protein GEMRC1_001803 [Eukaryota sp. GEM-RC1]